MIELFLLTALVIAWTIGQLEFISFWKSRRNARKTIKLSLVAWIVGATLLYINNGPNSEQFPLVIFKYYGYILIAIASIFIFGSFVALLVLNSHKPSHIQY